MRSSSGLIVVATSKPLSRVWDVRFWGGRDVVAVPPRPSGTLTGRVPMARLALDLVECQHGFRPRNERRTSVLGGRQDAASTTLDDERDGPVRGAGQHQRGRARAGGLESSAQVGRVDVDPPLLDLQRATPWSRTQWRRDFSPYGSTSSTSNAVANGVGTWRSEVR